MATRDCGSGDRTTWFKDQVDTIYVAQFWCGAIQKSCLGQISKELFKQKPNKRYSDEVGPGRMREVLQTYGGGRNIFWELHQKNWSGWTNCVNGAWLRLHSFLSNIRKRAKSIAFINCVAGANPTFYGTLIQAVRRCTDEDNEKNQLPADGSTGLTSRCNVLTLQNTSSKLPITVTGGRQESLKLMALSKFDIRVVEWIGAGGAEYQRLGERRLNRVFGIHRRVASGADRQAGRRARWCATVTLERYGVIQDRQKSGGNIWSLTIRNTTLFAEYPVRGIISFDTISPSYFCTRTDQLISPEALK